MTKEDSSQRPDVNLGDILKDFEGRVPGAPGAGRKYFSVGGSEAAGLDGQWSNPPVDFLLRSPGSRLSPEVPEPQIALNSSPASPLSDVFSMLGHTWLVSARARELFERVDGQAFVFVAAALNFRDGSSDRSYWLTDVVRSIDCVDVERSGIGATYDKSGAKQTLSVLGVGRIAFQSAAIGDARVFRIATEPGTVCCDERFKSAIQNAGLRGLQFSDWGRADV